MRHPTTSHTGSVGVPEPCLVEYHTHFNAHDEWVLACLRRADFVPGATYRGSELVDRQQLRHSYFWRAFLSRWGVTDIVTALIEASGADGPASFITFHRHQGQRPYAKADVLRLARLVPHLRQVLRLHRRLAPALAIGATLLELVQRLDQAVLFVAADGRVVERNPAAARLLAEPDGWLRDQQGRLQAATLQGWTELQPQLASLPELGSHCMDLARADRRSARLDIRLIQGAGSDQLATHPALAVCTLTPGARDRMQALQQVHGLTPAEARMALRIAQGRSAADIVAEQGLSMPTVRTHIAAALAKLGLSRQAQLAAFVLGV